MARRKSYRQWSADEIDILTAHIGDHGPTWPGWESLLPGRSPDAIKGRAYRIATTRQSARKLAVAHDPESDARGAMRLLRMGMTPSEADRKLGLAPGTARGLVVRAWQLGVL